MSIPKGVKPRVVVSFVDVLADVIILFSATIQIWSN